MRFRIASAIVLLNVGSLCAADLPLHAVRSFEVHPSLRSQPVRALAFTPDGKHLHAATTSTGVVRWPARGGKREGLGGPGSVTAAALLRDGSRGVFANSTRIIVWSERPEDLEIHQDNGEYVTTVALSPDGKLFASGGDNGLVHVRMGRTGADRHTLKGHTGYISSLAFDPFGQVLATGSHDRTIRLWDMATGKLIRTLEGHTDQVSALEFSPDGRTLASASWDRTARLWEVKTGKVMHRFEGHRIALTSVTVSDDRKILATGDLDGEARVWDLKTGKQLRAVEASTHEISSIALSRDGKLLATGDGDDTVRIWDAATGAMLHRCDPGDLPQKIARITIHSVALSPDRRYIASGGGDGAIRLYDCTTGKELRRLGRQHSYVWSVAFSPDGKHVASAGRRDGTVHIWDREKGGEVKRFTGQKGGITRVEYSRDGKLLIAAGGSFDPSIYLWDVESGKALHRLEGHRDYVDGIALSPDAKWAASASRDNTIRLWNLTTGKEARTLPAGDMGCKNLTFSPDGQSVAGGLGSGEVWLWDLATGKSEAVATVGSSELLHLAFARNGRSLCCVSASEAGWYEQHTGLIRFKVSSAGRENHYEYQCGASDPGGRWFVTGDSRGRMFLWDSSRLQGSTNEKLDALALEDCWKELALGHNAHQHLWRMSFSPEESVPFLAKRLGPTVSVSPRRISELVADLDNNRFRVRDQATRELEQMGDLAEGALKRELEKFPTLEHRRRIEHLLARLKGQGVAPAHRQQMYALEVLENIGNKEARALLERLAGGGDSRFTREAKAALRRLRP